jgi:lycopene cyclase domain-containing protein
MTYFGFLIRFLFIPILLMLVVTYFDHRAQRPTPSFDLKKVPLIIAVHVLLALVYTTPWDNYLVATGVWTYNPALVTGIVFGYVPIEEYTFFIVETLLAGLWWLFLARRLKPSRDEAFKANKPLIYYASALLVITWLIFTYLFFFGAEKWNYLGITLFWALPAIFPQFLFGADILWHHRKLVAATVIPLGTYLSLMDIIALRDTTWSISKTQTTGLLFFGILPLEEVVFFFITATIIGFGMTLMLSDLGWERFNAWKARGFKDLP